MIELTGLGKQYGSNIVLKDLSAHFREGRVYGVMGDNGAGKTTLFRCIAGLESYEGLVTCTEGILKNTLGFLPTDPWFFPKMTGLEYLRLACTARGKQPGDLGARNLFDLPLDRYASDFSTGMKKKLALMALLMQENRIFILDEPFNGIDLRSNIVVEGIIRRLKERGCTVIIASHIFSTLRDTCDEILVLKEGRFGEAVMKERFAGLETELQQGLEKELSGRLDLIAGS
jgi:ABC-2 type transport system ATP-binding protein